MSFDYLNEAFRKLDLLTEETFDASNKGRLELKDFMDADVESEEIKVIDPEVEDEEELQDSYIGKVITECTVCHSHIFEDRTDIVIDEDGAVNVDKQCPYCGEEMGFTVIGEIAPFGVAAEEVVEPEVPTEEAPVDAAEVVEDAEPLEEAHGKISTKLRKMLNLDEPEALEEDVNEIKVDTDDDLVTINFDEEDNVTVSTEKKEDAVEVDERDIEDEVAEEIPEEEEVISEVSDETKDDIAELNAEVVEVPAEDSASEDEEDIDIEEIDEESFDELGESYLKNIYENVDSFKTAHVRERDNKLVVEGYITFASGAKKKTGFIFEAHSVDKNGKLRLFGLNEHFSTSKKAYSMVGRVENKKFIAESLSYNYRVKNSAQRVRGTIHHK